MTMRTKPKCIDDYLAALSEDKRTALENLRKTIRAIAPKAEECISYQLPAFRLNGRPLVAFGGWANHCAFYAGAFPLAALKNELKSLRHQQGNDPLSSGQTPASHTRAEAGKDPDR